MRVLLDECLPRRLKQALPGHRIVTVREAGWAGNKNGVLLDLIQASDFDVFITIDGSLVYQQNVARMNFAIIVLKARDNSFDTLRPLMPEVLAALHSISEGDIVRVAAS